MVSLKDFNYEDIKVIGRGQYGKAHLVKSGQDQVNYIAKTIDLTCLSSKERESALQEVALLRRVDHPNIVQYKDNFFMGDTLVIVMQYCEGGDLATLIKDHAKAKKRMREELIMSYFVQVLHALQYIHGQRILHRDLKTSNLFLTEKQSVVKLGDFGISRVLEGSIEAAITVVGTPYYMSPEVCENKPYTFKSDVWALGCVLYELCMLKHAFCADNLLGLVYKIVSDKYDPIPKNYSAQLNNLIHQMLEKKAETRPSVADLLADPYTQRIEYNEAHGQCATPHGRPAGPSSSSSSRGPRAGHHGGGAGGLAKAQGREGGRATGTPTQRQGSGEVCADREAGAGEARGQARSRAPRQVGSGGGQAKETPKEAVERRKREVADRKAVELKQAAAQSIQNKTVARQMKEAQFGQTRIGSADGAASTRSPQTPGSAATTAANTPKHDEAWRPGGQQGHQGEDGDVTDEEDYSGSDTGSLETEEISEEEDYESDFEDEVATEDEEEGYARPPPPIAVGTLSTVREEQDAVPELMSRGTAGEAAPSWGQASPGASRRSREGTPAASSSTMARAGSPMTAASPVTRPPGTIIPLQERQSRLREECEKKVGNEVFHKAFEFLLDARQRGVDEKFVKKGLENIMGRENYRNLGLSIDQLVVQRLM